MSHPQRPAQICSRSAVATALAIGILACTLQARAQIVASKTRDLTPQEQKSAIAFTGEKTEEIMTVKGTVATFSRAGMQNIGAAVVWKHFVFSHGLCIAPVENLSAERKVGDKSIHWKVARTYSHHLPPGLSYFVWEGGKIDDCKYLPDKDLMSLTAPIPTPILAKLIESRHKIKGMALPLLRAKEKGVPDGHNKRLLSNMTLSRIDLDFDWKRGFVYTMNYGDDSGDFLIVHVGESGDQPVALSAGLGMP